MARIGQLQSAVHRVGLEARKAANKLAPGYFQTKNLFALIYQLNMADPPQVNFVAWADAALANRVP